MEVGKIKSGLSLVKKETPSKHVDLFPPSKSQEQLLNDRIFIFLKGDDTYTENDSVLLTSVPPEVFKVFSKSGFDYFVIDNKNLICSLVESK